MEAFWFLLPLWEKVRMRGRSCLARAPASRKSPINFPTREMLSQHAVNSVLPNAHLTARLRSAFTVRALDGQESSARPIEINESFLRELTDESRPLLHSSLLQLSGAPSELVAEMGAMWSSISHRRKKDIVARMLELANDNPELDFDELFLRLLSDPSDELREMAARGLWECEDRAAIGPLTEMLLRDPSTSARSAAAVSLGRFATLAAEGKLIVRDADRVSQALMSAVHSNNEDREVVWRSVESAAPFLSTDIMAIIEEGFRDGDSRVKQSAVHAMGRSADARWLPSLTSALDSDDAAIRHEAAESCGMVGDPSAVPHLISLLRDGDTQVEVAAVRALGAIGGDLARRALMRCLDFGDQDVEEAAEAAINELDAIEDPTGFSF